MFVIVAVILSLLWIWLVVHLAGVRGRRRLVWAFLGFFGGLIALFVLLVLPNLAKERDEAQRRADDQRLRDLALEESRHQTALLQAQLAAGGIATPARAPVEKAAGNS